MGFLLYVLPVLLLIIGPLVSYNCYRKLSDPLAGFDSTSTGFARIGNWAGIVLGIVAVLWAIWSVYRLFSQP
jgi:hypothetical protein